MLDGTLSVGQIIVPTSAVRDEGTSYHYLPPDREVKPGAKAVAAIERTLVAAGHHYVMGKTWTTDAFYRETRAKVELRAAEGDDLSGEWNERNWTRHEIRTRLFHLSATACLML